MKTTKKKQNLKTQLKNSSFMNIVGGMADDIFTISLAGGKLSLRDRPATGDPVERQFLQKRFSYAAAFAKAALANPTFGPYYMEVARGKLDAAWLAAVRDHLKLPFIDHIDFSKFHGAAGDAITIKAEGDFVVCRVQASILSKSTVIATGDAVQVLRDPLLWRWKVTAALPIGIFTLRVTAFDRSNNRRIVEESFVTQY